jgi:type IV secretory pathway VirB10-like protein
VIATAGVGAALFFALAPQRHTTGEELYSTDNRSTPDGLATLPKDYSALPRSVPRLGPPLPGDLGRPILEAGAPPPAMPGSIESSSDAQRTAQEQEAALTSRLFATTNFRQEAGRRRRRSPPSPPRPKRRSRLRRPISSRKTTSSPSSTARSIAARRARIASSRPQAHTCCRRGQSFPPR